MPHIIYWYLTTTILGFITFPLLYRLVPSLPDRGYPLARVAGLLLWGYVYWLLGVLGILGNDLGGLLFSFGLLLGVSVWIGFKMGWDEILSWLREHLRVVITTEILFAATFLGWAFVRANNPDIMGTEKPMELAFINAILRSNTLPPNDPWLSGHAISYYYFGYVMVAMLAKLTATSGSVAFNLGLSLVFALSALGGYSLIYNLLAQALTPGPSPARRGAGVRATGVRAALLGPFFTLIVSNWEGFLHYLHSKGIFWRVDESGQMVSGFWEWLGIFDLTNPPTGNAFGHWWWWRASRVIQDVDFTGHPKEVIHEFPFFSHLLGDLHPHVLAVPFGFLCLSLALNIFRESDQKPFRWLGILPLHLSPLSFGAAALAVGGISFLNTWDFPIYVVVLASAYALRRFINPDEEGVNVKALLGDFVSFGLALGITGIFFYLPFFLGLSSQAGGFIPNLIYVTRGAHLWVVFGPLFVPIFFYLLYLWRRHGNRRRLVKGISVGFGLAGVLLGIMLLFVFLMAVLSPLPGIGSVKQIFLGSLVAPNLREAVLEGLRRRVAWPGAWLTLVLMLTLVIGLLWREKRASTVEAGKVSFRENEPRPRRFALQKPRRSKTRSQPPDNLEAIPQKLNPSHAFVLLLTLWGAVVVLGPEFIFLKDMFGYRINTIFKFYYQAWLLWSVAAAYGSVVLLRKLRPVRATLFLAVLVLTLGMALVYPVKGLWAKTSAFSPSQGRTLDGAAFFERSSSDDADAAAWLENAPFGVVAEAVGGSYSSFARVSIYSGLPTVLGWDFHEIQWRGNSEQVTPRQSDITTLYCTPQWETARSILEKYDIQYVVIGSLERNTYRAGESNCPQGLQEAKFTQNLPQVVRFGQTAIYVNEW